MNEVKSVFIKKGDLVKHPTLGTGIIQEVDTKMLHVKFDNKDRISRFMISDFSSTLRKYFKEENVYKEYNPLTQTWFNEDGYDDEGFNRNGYNRAGYDREGFSKRGIHFKTRSRYNLDGFDINGYDQNGFDKKGVHYIKKHPLKFYDLVTNHMKGDINKDSFRDALISVGRQSTDQIIKEELRELYKGLLGIPDYWEESIKKKIVSNKGWDLFSPYERTDRPPPEIPNKRRAAYCYNCKGSLYAEIHLRCSNCNWLICPYCNSCGCGFEYKYPVMIL